MLFPRSLFSATLSLITGMQVQSERTELMGLYSTLQDQNPAELQTLTSLATDPSPPQDTTAGSDRSAAPQYEIYLNPLYRFRLAYPAGYVIDSSSAVLGAEPPLLQRLELWSKGNYNPLLWLAPDPNAGAEWPPHIAIEVYENPEKKPLIAWVQEPLIGLPQTTTIAGEAALFYRSTGLYEAENYLVAPPDSPFVFHFQVNYLDQKSDDRSTFAFVVNSLVFDPLPTEEDQNPINFDRLETLLKEQNWQLADLETRSIIEQLIGTYNYFYPHYAEPKNPFTLIECSTLNKIDQLWQDSSQGHFGYTPQLNIWHSVQKTIDPSLKFAQTIGWWQAQTLEETTEIPRFFGETGWKLDTELNYDLNAPRGHLPWMGVSSLTFERMLAESGPACGSCTVDVMYMVSDRFSDYLPAFYDRVQACPVR